ncbi:MAG: cache domain-containing protein [Candidatus Acetothermia bacterium]|jgi:two-component system NtrC family sensor kinase|nr:cache domain-containing protein [Candidatus Acetothermia bacterium]MDH7505399.1 cache domain-containing protein [Candidatus Acetothermia bacterium]
MGLWRSFCALRSSLRGRLILSFLAVVILGIAISAWVGIRLIGDTVLAQAQSKVQHDLAAAWMVYNTKLKEIRSVVELTAERFFIREPFRGGELGPAQSELERVRRERGLDFLTLTDRAGVVLIRTREPYTTGDDHSGDEPVRRALAGEAVAATVLIPREQLLLEGAGLAEQAGIEPVPTPRAKPQPEAEVTAGMALLAAAAVWDEAGRVLGALYGGVLLNRSYELVDRIKETVYKGERYLGKEVGTATIFQWDLRISTNVRTAAGERAIGTRVSAEVYDRVLAEGRPWTDRAFVVNDWYVTAYEPIKDINGKIIGMLYVGMLEAPFAKMRAEVVWAIVRYSSLSLALALGLAFLLGRRITKPVEELARASEAISLGRLSQRVESRSKDELGRLAASFNRMAASLERTLAEKDRANQRLQDLNLRYLELLGFATHELMQPLGVLKGYLTLMRASATGALEPDRQRQAVAAMLRNLDSLINMSRMYLELSRIESGELEVHKERVRVYQDVLAPVIEDARMELERRGMRLTLEDERAWSALELEADPILLRAVFSNLIGNAIKYGREGGEIRCGFKDEGASYRFHVWNEGPGIPTDKLGAIFEKFVRLEREAGPQGRRGTGLGLFITKEIIARHGGAIWAESVEGEWADFIFRLPKEN